MIYQFFWLGDAKIDEGGEKLQLLTDNNGGAQIGMGTQSAVTVIGSGIFLFFVLACCIAIFCKYK